MGLAERGFVEFEVYYDTEIHPGYGGGQHLFAVSSQNAPQAGPYDPEIPHLNGWYKVDFSPRESDQLRGVLYYDSDPGAGVTLSTIFLGTWPLRAWRTWGHLRVEWEQSPQRTLLRVNGRQVEVPAFNGMSPLGNLLVVGNMDRNSGERCVGYPRDPCGTLGKIRYRGFQWGR
jgi:hypothetical protein